VRLNRIGLKLVVAVAAVLALEAAVRYYLETTAQARVLHADFMHTGRFHALTLARSAEYGLLTADAAELRQVAEMLHLAGDTSLLAVAFYDEHGTLLAEHHWGHDHVALPPEAQPVPQFVVTEEAAGTAGDARYAFRAPVRISRTVLGDGADVVPPAAPAGTGLVVAYRSYREVADAIAAVHRNQFAVSALVFAVFLAAALGLAAHLARPIRRLAAGTERVAAGDLSTRVDVGRRRDELRALADAFNRMTDRLDRQHRKIVSYSRDLEEMVQQRTAELADANADLERELAERRRAEEELRRSNAELRQFAYVASHDLQEPLRMVTSYVQLLAHRYRGHLDDDADEFIAYAVNGAERMKALINDVLEYSRVGRRDVPFERVDCDALLDDVLANLQVAVHERGAEITRDPLPTVQGDRHQLTCVFQNLVSNALKFCEGTPEIHVSAERDGDRWRLAVSDNGIGIDAEYRDRIFHVFKRLHARHEFPGTGMGLAITKKIIERHGGTIDVASEPGQGTTFTFTLPAAPDEAAARPAEASAAGADA
jgi:signal transduction histidine kinase